LNRKTLGEPHITRRIEKFWLCMYFCPKGKWTYFLLNLHCLLAWATLIFFMYYTLISRKLLARVGHEVAHWFASIFVIFGDYMRVSMWTYQLTIFFSFIDFTCVMTINYARKYLIVRDNGILYAWRGDFSQVNNVQNGGKTFFCESPAFHYQSAEASTMIKSYMHAGVICHISEQCKLETCRANKCVILLQFL
jgi:hypothetical protein